MIWLIGAGGYVGSAFTRELIRRGQPFRVISRTEIDCARFEPLLSALRAARTEFVINAAGFTGKPNVDACETQRDATILGNIVLPQTVAEACAAASIPFGTVASGCIYKGAPIESNDGAVIIETDLTAPHLQGLLESRSPRVRGFVETDEPNFTFAQQNCSFYSGTKAVGEQVLAQFPDAYIWRLRLPFESRDSSRNLLSKLQRYPKAYQNWNSLSHVDDFVMACLDTWRLRLPGGCYNIVNPGYASTREVVALIEKHLRPGWEADFWKDDQEFYTQVQAPRSNCLLDPSKIIRAGVKIRPVQQALEDSLQQWSVA